MGRILAADRAVDRLEAVTNRFPSLETRIPADHIVTVYIPVTVDEVVHEAAIKFAAVNDIPEIGFSR